jgi:hypothetical protein
VHSLPALSDDDLRGFVNEMSERTNYMFVTNLDQDYYASWGATWQKFFTSIPTLDHGATQ